MRSVAETVVCEHCGLECQEDIIRHEGHAFCCIGCKSVYQLLADTDFSSQVDKELFGPQREELAFLEDEDVQRKLYTFHEGDTARIEFELPEIHCSSCIRLLENLMELNSGVSHVRVNFLTKKAGVAFHPPSLSLRKLVELLYAIGYPPKLQLESLHAKEQNFSKKIYYKLGLAGFCFGNIMLFSFPEYLGISDQELIPIFRGLNILLVLPVLFYAAADYWRSAWASLKLFRLNIDVPIVLGMGTLFVRSLYEILGGMGEGYLDSLAGFTFFLLIGRWFQDRTFDAISFDRDYRSYFPMSVMKKTGEQRQSVSIDKIEMGDRLIIRNGELIPVDGVLKNGKAVIDYSFVTGESAPVSKSKGEKIFAGGRQTGGAIEVEANTKVDQSYLTKLWDEEPFLLSKTSRLDQFLDKLGKNFTISILMIAAIAGIIWWYIDPTQTFLIITSVLIVACPCAIALAVPFVYGSLLRHLSMKGFFLRNVSVIRQLQDIDTIVFDKTGTLTDPDKYLVSYKGEYLDNEDRSIIASLCQQSTHPKAQAILHFLNTSEVDEDIQDFKEAIGAGMSAIINDVEVRLGSALFVFGSEEDKSKGVFLELDGVYKGVFSFTDALRSGIEDLIQDLSPHYKLALLSGDSEESRPHMEQLFPSSTDLCFHMKPDEKLRYVKELQESGHQVLFIGDGLNDAGALRQSDAGIVLSSENNHFTPASDGIFPADRWGAFFQYLTFIKKGRELLWGAFLFALLYNLIGLGFAVQGLLSPVVAAILMPLSSISIMVYGLVSVRMLSLFNPSNK